MTSGVQGFWAPCALLSQLHERVYGSHSCSCLGKRERRIVSTGTDAAQGEQKPAVYYKCYADFLGSAGNPDALMRMTVAHASQVSYATSSEAVSLALPYINAGLGGDVQQYGHLSALSAGLQLCGGLAFGALGDKYGSRMALILAHSSALTSAVLVATAQSSQALLFSMFPYLAMHGYQAASQVAVKNSTQESRSIAMGRMGMSYGVGFLGGTCLVSLAATRLTPKEIAGLAAVIEAGILALVLIAYPPEVNIPEACTNGSLSVDAFRRILCRPHVTPLLCIKLAACVSGGMIFCMIQQFAMDPFGYSAAQTGLIMSYVGGVQLFTQGIIAPALDGSSPRALRLGSLVSLGIPLFGMAAQCTSSVAYVFWLGPLTAAIHASGTAINSKLSCLVPESESGTIVALSMLPMTFGFLVSPLISGWVIKFHGFGMVPMVAMASLVTVATAVASLESTDKDEA